jgi:hypothetical protein
MMSGQPPVALIGAIIGAGIGFTNGLVIGNLVISRLRALDRSETDDDKVSFETRITALRWITLVVLVTGTAALGFGLGHIVG